MSVIFGTYKLLPDVAQVMVKEAISAGIKHIDTAQLYNNEEQVYNVTKEYPDVQLTTKIHRRLIRQADRDNRAIENSVEIKPTTVLLHSPEKNYQIAWSQLCRLSNRGISVGVSNFSVEQLKQLTTRKPDINQIEVTPFNLCLETVKFCKNNYIRIEAHSALTRTGLFGLKVFNERDLTPAQLLIQWSLDHGYSPIFSTSNVDHLNEIAGLRVGLDRSVYIPMDWNIGYRTHLQYTIK